MTISAVAEYIYSKWIPAHPSALSADTDSPDESTMAQRVSGRTTFASWEPERERKSVALVLPV